MLSEPPHLATLGYLTDGPAPGRGGRDPKLARALAALGDPDRLRLLVELAGSGEEGLGAGALADRARVGPVTEFHLAFLVRAGLVRARHRGGRTSYTVAEDNLREIHRALPA